MRGTGEKEKSRRRLKRSGKTTGQKWFVPGFKKPEFQRCKMLAISSTRKIEPSVTEQHLLVKNS